MSPFIFAKLDPSYPISQSCNPEYSTTKEDVEVLAGFPEGFHAGEHARPTQRMNCSTSNLPDPLLMDHRFTIAGDKIAVLTRRLAA